MLIPGPYLKSLDAVAAACSHPEWSYLRGELRLGGWWWFYVYGLAAAKLSSGRVDRRLLTGGAPVNSVVRAGQECRRAARQWPGKVPRCEKPYDSYGG